MDWSGDSWESSQPGPHADIFALGVISLNYGQLETMFGHLFGLAVGMTELQTGVLFQRIQNNVRVELFRQLSSARDDLTPPFAERLMHFSDGYAVCVDNRNAIMHSHSAGMHSSLSKGTAGLLLRKHTKSGGRLVCLATSEILRAVADDIHRYTLFAASLCTDLQILPVVGARGETYQPSPLSDKPALPTALSWLSEVDFEASLTRP